MIRPVCHRTYWPHSATPQVDRWKKITGWILFSPETWQEAAKIGYTVTGFRRHRWKGLTKQLKAHYGEHGIEVKDTLRDDTPMQGRQLHFRVDSPNHMWYASTPFEDWKSECSLYDEPYSSGQTDPKHTDIRNDFVILRFRRKSQA